MGSHLFRMFGEAILQIIKDESFETPSDFRIEAYDIAHLSGMYIVGVMTVVEKGEAQKSEYRKFKIKGFHGVDDTKALREILERRLAHPEWQLPKLIVVDGGVAQKNVAEQVLRETSLKIPVIGVVKDERHKAKTLLGNSIIKDDYEKQIILANSEAHNFALSFHRRSRRSRWR